jgi:hypothetical protein
VIIRPAVGTSGIVGEGAGSEVAVGEGRIVGVGVELDGLSVGCVVG